MAIPRYTLDGTRIKTLEDFYDQFQAGPLEGAWWGRNLDALDDVLSGNYGPVPSTFALVWRNSMSARAALGHGETVRQLQGKLAEAHSSHHSTIREQIARAERQECPTVFDWILEIVRNHSNVTLLLE